MELITLSGQRKKTLDAWRPAGSVRIQTQRWILLQDLPSGHFVQPRSLRRLVSYALEVGPKATLNKVTSRYREEPLSARFMALVLGQIVEADDAARQYQNVWALVPAASALHERIVCDERLTIPASGALEAPFGRQILSWRDLRHDRRLPRRALASFAGWSPYAHSPLALEQVRATMDELVAIAQAKPVGKDNQLTLSLSAIKERALPPVFAPSSTPAPAHNRPPIPSRPSAILFGLGHYARTCILPHIQEHLKLEAIHELDPEVLSSHPQPAGLILDSCPQLRPDERADVVLVAGYHHTHAPIALEALSRGAFVVVEKPAVTSLEQLEALSHQLKKTPRLFTGYHRRYELQHQWLFEDLRGYGPCDYHAIIYEAKLPPLHWYRWPSAHSAVLSNACHWIDQFLLLNPGREPESWRAQLSPTGALHLWIVLEGGATCSLTLSDRGSAFGGVRELVEVRAEHRSVRLIDGQRYIAQSSSRTLREHKVRRQHAYALMYEHIARTIASGQAKGDDPAHFVRLNRLLLALDQEALACASSSNI